MKQKKCQSCGYEFQPQEEQYTITTLLEEDGIMVSLFCPNDKCGDEIEWAIVKEFRPVGK